MAAKRTATSKVVAEALGVSTATIQAYARSGRIPFSATPGGHRRFDVAEVQLALEPSGNVEHVSTLLIPLPQRDLTFGSTPPDRARLAEMAELSGSRPEGRTSASHHQHASSTGDFGRSALGMLLKRARSSRLGAVGA